MDRIRVTSLCFAIGLAVAPLPAYAQSVQARLAALEAAVAALQNSQTAEATARAAADTTLQGNINAEAGARTAADTTLQAGTAAETAARAAADTTLQEQIDKLKSGQIDPLDLVGTYAVQLFQRSLLAGVAPADRLETEVLTATFTLHDDFSATIISATDILCKLRQETATTWSRPCSEEFSGSNVAGNWFIDGSGTLRLQIGGQDVIHNPNFIGAGGRVIVAARADLSGYSVSMIAIRLPNP